MSQSQFQIEGSQVALFKKNGAVAIRTDENGHSCLPMLSLPWGSRPAEVITDTLRRECGLDAVYLWNVSPVESDRGRQTHIAEALDPFRLPDGWKWTQFTTNNPESLGACELEDIHRAYTVVTAYAGCRVHTQLGWFETLVDWANDALLPRNTKLVGGFRQLNGGGAFLVRLKTADGAVWYKAPGTASSSEWNVTTNLAQAAPEWLPEVFGSNSEWKGWLSEDIGSSLYGQTADLCRYHLAAVGLARLQMQLQNRTDWLFDIGIQDQSLPHLRSKIPALLEMLDGLMSAQSKSPPTALGKSDLYLIGGQLDSSLSILENCGFPDSIIHGDITPGSIVTNGKRCAFIDWSRAYVGFPPICCELMLNKFAPLLGECPKWRTQLWRAYLDCWPGYADFFDSEEAQLSLALVSLFAYVLTKADVDHWHPYVAQPTAGYFRSIGRRMFSIASKIVGTEGGIHGHA